MKIKYVGPHDEVSVDSLGLIVGRDIPVEVEKKAAESLCEQSDWTEVGALRKDEK